MRSLGLAALLLLGACASAPRAPRPALVEAPSCAHRAPADECTRCEPSRRAAFEARGDWCAEHGLPETHCHECHPGLRFYALPALPQGADLVHASRMGEDVPSIEGLAVPGKVTIVDFFAHWCAPCREIDAFVFAWLREHPEVAVRKLNVHGWDSPLAKRHLQGVRELPYLVVFGPDGARRGEVRGADLERLAELIQ